MPVPATGQQNNARDAQKEGVMGHTFRWKVRKDYLDGTFDQKWYAIATVKHGYYWAWRGFATWDDAYDYAKSAAETRACAVALALTKRTEKP